MVNEMIMIAVGTALGFLAGIGVGGGSLLILWLTFIVGLPHPQARLINLLFFLPSAITASLFRWKQGSLEIKKILPAAIGGTITAAVFSIISYNMDTQVLGKLFGLLLLATGIRELLYKPKGK